MNVNNAIKCFIKEKSICCLHLGTFQLLTCILRKKLESLKQKKKRRWALFSFSSQKIYSNVPYSVYFILLCFLFIFFALKKKIFIFFSSVWGEKWRRTEIGYLLFFFFSSQIHTPKCSKFAIVFSHSTCSSLSTSSYFTHDCFSSCVQWCALEFGLRFKTAKTFETDSTTQHLPI